MKENVKRIIFKGLSFTSDRTYLSALYYFRTKKIMNWKGQKAFGEKLQWLKDHD